MHWWDGVRWHADAGVACCRLDDGEAARSQRELHELGVSSAAGNPLSLSKIFQSGGLSTELHANLHPGILSNLLNSSVQFPSISGDLPGLTAPAPAEQPPPGARSPGAGSPGNSAMDVDGS